MGYKNPKQLLDAATALPVAIEAKLPAGAPKVSTKLLEFNSNIISKLPDFPVELPGLPAVPELPGLPGDAGLRTYVSSAEIIPSPSLSGGQRGTIAPAPRGRLVGTRGRL